MYDDVVDAIPLDPEIQEEEPVQAHDPRKLQFYTTRPDIAKRLKAMFKDHDVERLLDACAGTGALADAWVAEHDRRYGRRAETLVDCIEIDPRHHPTLREKGYTVVGLDLLSFEGGEVFSTVVCNPPFALGARYALKIYDMLWEGEIGLILNAETIRNPYTRDRKRLVDLVDKFGEVEFVEDAFKGDVEREADVEIALVHLVKKAESSVDWIGPIIDQMAVDQQTEEKFELPHELTLPAGFVETQCRAFRQAVKAMREATKMAAVAELYANRIGKTMGELAGDAKADAAPSGGKVREGLRTGYDQLKDRAWASVLRSTETLTRLSSNVQRQAEAQFASIKKLDFTETNIWSFLHGLVLSQPEMQDTMVLDCFDLITRYHTDNAVFYMGWRSNDLHLSAGKRIKYTRFILPGHTGYSHSLKWESMQLLADFDKCFALLDGKQRPEIGLVDVAQTRFGDLRLGRRVSSSYFDIRWYPGIGTLHVFPTDKALIDRFNRTVGRLRKWLPDESEAVPDVFWRQFKDAEKFDAAVRRRASEKARAKGAHSRWDNPVMQFMRGDESRSTNGEQIVAEAIHEVLRENGLLLQLGHNGIVEAPLQLTAD